MICGIMGQAQSGKDEFAKIAVKEFGAIRVAFADAVKEEVGEFLKANDIPFEDRNLWGSGSDKEELFNFHHFTIEELDYLIEPYVKFINGRKYTSFRALLQIWGTEYRRSQDLDYWVKRGLDKCSPIKTAEHKDLYYTGRKIEVEVLKNFLYTITDVRFMNEAKAIKAVGGKLIKIVRPDAPSISNASHKSEQELKGYEDYDYFILNNGTLEEYHNNCRKVINKILGEINE